jgi:hypothetical protein
MVSRCGRGALERLQNLNSPNGAPRTDWYRRCTMQAIQQDAMTDRADGFLLREEIRDSRLQNA